MLSVIIPCYNEEESLPWVVSTIPKLPWSTEIVVVDDGSKDNTAKVAKSLMKKRRNLRLVSYKPNGGKGFAFRKGLEAAKGEVVVIQDADMNAGELESIVRPIFEGTADFVNGSRMVYPKEKGAMKALHVPGNMAFALIVSAMIGTRITDSLCGYKAFRRKKLLGKLKENSWPDFELLLKAAENRLKIVEVPIHYNARKAGKSKMKTFKHGWRMLQMLLRASFSK